MKQFYVYVLASKKNGTLYVGVTSDLVKRVWEHKNSVVPSFTSKYDVINLVHYEIFDDSENAFNREKQLKNWKRHWKLNLIEEKNPEWKDLYQDLNP